MAEEPKQQQEEESCESAPLWIISFADMISLLMAFFVMLTTFASFGPAESAEITGIARIALLPNYGWFSSHPKTAMEPKKKAVAQAERAEKVEKGSEKPTLEQSSDGMSLSETVPKGFRIYKVFLLESKIAFWANGTTLSRKGRDFFNNLASFVSKVPSRIIISESGSDDKIDFGITRSIVVMKYLVDKGISADYCNISTEGMSPTETFKGERMLEIVLLDESAVK
jgi:outer membrane protein OmpA-like peptidoglycan-associated protein